MILKSINKIKRLKHKWLSPFAIGLIPALIIFYIQPIAFLKFSIEPMQLSGRFEWFDDLDGNGNSEMLSIGDFEKRMYIYSYNDKGEFLGQFNFSSPSFNPDYMPLPYSFDFNGDHVKDIVLFSVKRDSLFLDIFNFTKQENLNNTKYITKLGGFNTQKDYSIHWIKTLTVNDEPIIYFAVNSGFALYPRRIFGYNVKQDSVFATINLGSKPNLPRFIKTNKGWTIICFCHAYGNTQEDYPYPYLDSCCWVMGFDQNLKMSFEPKSFAPYPAAIYPIKKVGKNVYFNNAKIGDFPDMNKLYKMDFQGKLLDSTLLNFNFIPMQDSIKISNKYFQLLLNPNGEYVFVDLKSLKIINSKYLNRLRNKILYFTEDFDKDGEEEYLFSQHGKRITLYSYNLKKVGELFPDKDYQRYYSYKHQNGRGELLLSSKKGTMHYSVIPNSYYIWKYPLLLGIYLLSVLFVWLLLYFQRRNINKRLQLEKRIVEVQLQNLRNQLDPHFTFNALNSVGNAIYKQDKEQAYKLFQRFTRMIRSSLLVSDKVFRTLDEELQFTRDYLEFQKTRFKELFDYYFEIDDSIKLNEIQIPKMLIQSFVENSVKHAFFKMDTGGKIWLRVSVENKQIKIVIEDNGIGINISKELGHTSGTQKGEKLLIEQVEQINQLYNKSIKITINDLKESSQHKSGTIVTLFL